MFKHETTLKALGTILIKIIMFETSNSAPVCSVARNIIIINAIKERIQ